MNRLLEIAKSKKHIIWDFNGTLLDDVHHAVGIINEILKDHQLPALTKEKYQEVFCFPVRNYYEKVGFNFQQHNFETLSHRFVDNFMEKIDNCRIFPHALDLLTRLHKANTTQSVLSATDQENLERLIERFGLRPYFQNVVGIQDKFASSKMEQGRQLIQKSNFAPVDTLLIGDTDHDLHVGQELGIDVVLLAHGHQAEHRLKAIHNHVYRII